MTGVMLLKFVYFIYKVIGFLINNSQTYKNTTANDCLHVNELTLP